MQNVVFPPASTLKGFHLAPPTPAQLHLYCIHTFFYQLKPLDVKY